MKNLIFIIVLTLLPFKAYSENSYDIAIYGATAAGIIAAIEAAESKNSVIIIEPGEHLGGMLTGGLSNTDIGEKKALGGKAKTFFQKIKVHYQSKYTWKFEPHVAKEILEKWLKKHSIKVVYKSPISSIEKVGNRILSLSTFRNKTFQAEYFIDASYEADLMAMSEVSYNIGRESQSVYNEIWAGFRGGSPVKKHAFNSVVSAYKEGELLPGIKSPTNQKTGNGDQAIPAYNFRLCLSKSNKKAIPAPTNYDATQYELLAQELNSEKEISSKNLFSLTSLPNKKFGLSASGPFSTDYIGGSWAYPEADFQTRQIIWNQHKEYILGFFHFFKSDPRVPMPLKNYISRLGLCKDEFVENNNWPPQLYVRVARRMLGEFILTEKDVLSDLSKPDPIAIGSRPIELRHTQRIALEDWKVLNEGHNTILTKPYQIPYRSITPKKLECENLLVPVAASASYVAYNSLRTEPVYMMLGQAAGAAASLAIKDGRAVQDLDYQLLRKRLIKNRQVLSIENLP